MKINKLAIIKNPVHFLAFGLGLGFMPIAPGTAGTLLGVILYYLNISYSIVNEVILVLVASIIGIYLCGKTARDINYHDHPGIVWDEVAGYLVTMLFVPFSVFNIIIGFILFRIFDIVKPWPIKAIDQKVAGGLGIMLDDIIAGVFSCVSLHMYLFVF